MEWAPPCEIEGMPFDDYLGIDAASSSFLKRMLSESPKHAKEKAIEESDAMRLGTAAHALILEPHTVKDALRIKPDGAGKASNAAKTMLVDFLIEALDCEEPAVDRSLATGKQLDHQIEILQEMADEAPWTIVTQAQFDNAQRMRDSVMSQRYGQILFPGGKPEVSKMARDPLTGVLCKVRIDWEPDGHHVLVDVKSTASAVEDKFARKAGELGYHLQAVLYQRIDRIVRGASAEKDFLHVVIENEPPFDVVFYELKEKERQAGVQRLNRSLDIYKLCQTHGVWPGIGWDWNDMDYAIKPLTLPKWSL